MGNVRMVRRERILWAGFCGLWQPPALHVRLCVYFSGLRKHQILRRGLTSENQQTLLWLVLTRLFWAPFSEPAFCKDSPSTRGRGQGGCEEMLE